VQKSFDALVDDDGRLWHVGQQRFQAQISDAVTPTAVALNYHILWPDCNNH